MTEQHPIAKIVDNHRKQLKIINVLLKDIIETQEVMKKKIEELEKST